jgi:hypothetical protein
VGRKCHESGHKMIMLPLVEEASLVEAFVDLFLFVIVTSTSTCDCLFVFRQDNKQ